MKLKMLTVLLIVPALLLAAGLSGWWWLLHTEPGARWLFHRAASSVEGSVTASVISGDLGSGLRLEQFHFDDGSISVDAERLVVAINIDLMPLHITIENLGADSVLIKSRSPSSAESAGEFNLPVINLPFTLAFPDIKISGIEYTGPAEESILVADSIAAAGSLHQDLVLDRLSITLPEDRLSLSGKMTLLAPHPLSLQFQAEGAYELKGRLDGNLDSATLVLDAVGPEVHINGTVGQLLGTPAWDLQVNSPLIQLPLESPEPAATLTRVEVHTTGEWPVFNLDLAGSLEAGGLTPSELTLSGSGTDKSFTTRHLRLEGPELALDASGTISLEDTLDLGFEVVLNRIDPATWMPQWPEEHPVHGEVAVEWAGEDISISKFRLAVAGTELSATGHGIYALESGSIDAALSWNNFSWPLDSASPALNSKTGKIQISGRPEDWKLDGILDLKSGEFPSGQLRLSGTGDDESFDITVQEGKVLGGTIAGSLFWNWTGGQPFKAELTATQIDITPLFADYPGVLNARLKADGELEPLRVAVSLEKLDGIIRQHPVSGQGGFHIEQDRLTADGLQLASGSSTLTLDGSLYQPEGIDFSAEIDSLDQFSEDLGGRLSMAGNMSLFPGSPRISASLSGDQLKLGGIEIERIETRNTSGPGNAREVFLSGLTLGQRPVEMLSIRFEGERPLTRMAINARIEGMNLGLELNGSVDDWSDPLNSGWSGELSTVQIEHKNQFTLSLEQASAIEWSPTRFVMQQACFSGTRNAHLCMASSWTAPDQLDIAVDLEAIPAGLVELFYDTDLRFTQVLNGKLNWSDNATDGQAGAARLELSPGAIHLVDDDVMLLETGPSLFGFEVNGGQLQKGNMELNIPGTGDIKLDFSIPDLSMGSYSPVKGAARIDLYDLSRLGQISPFFDTFTGALDVDLVLSGILSDPAYTGHASLTDGQLANKASGLSFSDINLSGEVDDTDRSELTGTFRAGAGGGDVTAVVYFDNVFSPVIELALKGESLTVIDVPDLKVIANPDLQLAWSAKTLSVNGRLMIPSARLSPSAIPENAVSQSSDVVIVAGELPEAEPDFLRDNAISIRGNLDVELGKEVIVDLDFAKLKASGKTRFTWLGDTIPIAEGSFNMRGEIQAYGQLLQITRGRIGFPGIPADNPHLNIRAERDIYGNSQIRKAGLMVAGTLRRPIIEPYTVPMTNKDRARTLLVTGSDFDYEQGVGAVSIGTYILPRLYVSYGIGVFEDDNVFSMRYDIGRGFGVKATSGQRATGLDLNYMIER